MTFVCRDHRTLPWLKVWIFALLVVAWVGQPAQAQMSLPMNMVPPQGGGAQPPAGFTAPPPEPAPIDTVGAKIVLPDGIPAPTAVYVVPDTLLFGGPTYVVLDFPGSEAPVLTDSLGVDVSWLIPVPPPEKSRLQTLLGTGDPTQPDLSNLPATDGQRLVWPLRTYRFNPFFVQAGDVQSSVVQVIGRTDGLGEAAAIRQPRVRGFDPLTLALLALGALIILFIIWWIWRRRQARHPGLEDWDLPAPAWLQAAIDFQALQSARLLERGDCRGYLDQLAAIVRGYVSDRYRIAAREMTGAEIVAACRRLGHQQSQPMRFAALIDAADRHRYDPEAPQTPWCRAQAGSFYQVMARVRIHPRYTPVSADQMLAADKAWTELNTQFGGDVPQQTMGQTTGQEA